MTRAQATKRAIATNLRMAHHELMITALHFDAIGKTKHAKEARVLAEYVRAFAARARKLKVSDA